jgi:hypothetical protein
MLVTQQKCAGNTFIMEESTNPVKQQKKKKGRSVTAQPESLKFYLYLLLYAAYSWLCLHFKINAPPNNKLIYCNCLDLECYHLHWLPKVKTQVPPQVATGGLLPE